MLFDIPIVAAVMVVESLERLKYIVTEKNEEFEMRVGEDCKKHDFQLGIHALRHVSATDL